MSGDISVEEGVRHVEAIGEVRDGTVVVGTEHDRHYGAVEIEVLGVAPITQHPVPRVRHLRRPVEDLQSYQMLLLIFRPYFHVGKKN